MTSTILPELMCCSSIFLIVFGIIFIIEYFYRINKQKAISPESMKTLQTKLDVTQPRTLLLLLGTLMILVAFLFLTLMIAAGWILLSRFLPPITSTVIPELIYCSAVFLITLGLIIIYIYKNGINKREAIGLGSMGTFLSKLNNTQPRKLLLIFGILLIIGAFIILALMISVGWIEI
jgi:hypothetical protein